jgi:DNA repair protein RecO (recombination protein O)
MRVPLQPVYVIHTRNYRDTSLLIELFSRDYGRLSLVAKGARSGKSRGGNRAALLQPFAPLLCSWSGRSELKTLTGCESDGLPLSLRRERLYSGLYVNELISRLLHHEDPHQRLFDEYQLILGRLAEEEAVEMVLRRFEFRLLEELGYGFELGVDGNTGQSLEEKRWYTFHQDYGLVPWGPGEEPEVPRFLGAELLALSHGNIEPAARQCAKRLMRRVLSIYLGDKPLKSRELFVKPA